MLDIKKLKLDELNRTDLPSFQIQPKTALVLVLDNIRSALNVGAAFRTADAFALEKIVLCGISAQPPHREILKTALGSTESVAWEYVENTKDAVQLLRNQGFIILGIEQTDKSILLQDITIEPAKKYALIFGNEVEGVSETALPMLDACVEIPQFGTKHSLNVSVCVGIVAWEFLRRMRGLGA
jgi:23S rRNA (guanosine2251-2'-O)-methyltransferase